MTMNHKQQFIKHFFSEIATLDYTYLNFIGGDLAKIDTQSDIAILIDAEHNTFIDSVIRKFDNMKSTVLVSMSYMDQFAITFEDGNSLNVDCMSKLIRRNLVYLSNEYIFENTVFRSGVKCCNNNSFFELMMLFHQLNNEGMSENYSNYFKTIPSFDNIVTAFNKKYHSGFTAENIHKHDPEFKTWLKNYLTITRDNAFAANMRNTFSYIKEKCARMLTGQEKIMPFDNDGAIAN